MNLPGLVFLIIAHYFTGRGILSLFRLQQSAAQATCFSFIIGVPLLSFVPCIVQLCGQPITFNVIFCAIAIFTIICSIPLMVRFKRPQLPRFVLPEIYEWPFIVVCLAFVTLSVWRCFYYPPTPRDMLAGPELLADYAIREQTMISSVFTIDLSTTNNLFKSPYITGLQIIYKLLVSPFGQLWMSVLYVPFIAFMYKMLRQRVHVFLAGLLLLLFITVPDLFAYSFVMLYDYSNMVFFFCGFYFLIKHLNGKQLNDFFFSAFLFGLATYIRVETIVLVGMMALLPFIIYIKERTPLKHIMLRLTLFMVVPALFYLICMQVFVRSFIPIPFDTAHEINPALGHVGYFFQRLKELNTVVIFSAKGLAVYGYFLWLFFAVLLGDICSRQRFSREAWFALFGVAVIYFGLPLLGYLLPLYDVNNTTKRGMFKIVPLMLLYLANSGLVQRLSALITKWEFYQKKEPPKEEVELPANS